MDFRQKLQGFDKDKPREVARKHNISGANKLRKDELIEAIQQCPEKEMRKALGLGFWQRYKRTKFIFKTLFPLIFRFPCLFPAFTFYSFRIR